MTLFTKKLHQFNKFLKWGRFHIPGKRNQADLDITSLKVEGIERSRKNKAYKQKYFFMGRSTQRRMA